MHGTKLPRMRGVLRLKKGQKRTEQANICPVILGHCTLPKSVIQSVLKEICLYGIMEAGTMQEKDSQKIKLVKMLELLRQETDEAHPILKSDLMRRLAEMGTNCSVRALTDDIKLLQKEGFAVRSVKIGHARAYYIADRGFSPAELRILMDAAQAASFIPERETAELRSKLASLGGSHEAELLGGNPVRFNTHKHENGSVMHTVLFLGDAVRQGRKAAFCYFDLNENLERVYRYGHAMKIVQPLGLVYNSDRYYLLCYDEEAGIIKAYRVDRMDSAAVLMDEISANAESAKNDLGEYVSQMFKMFAGELRPVTLEFTDAALGSVIDHFGEVIRIERIGPGRLRATVDVQVSPVFFGWVFQFAGDMRITGPDAVTEAFREHWQKLG